MAKAVTKRRQPVHKQVASEPIDPSPSASSADPNALQAAPSESAESGTGMFGTKLATVAVVGLAAALIEVEWIPGLLLGVAAMAAPNLLPRLGRGLRPLLKGTVRAGYSLAEKTRETIAAASEQLQDLAAEARTEQSVSSTPPSHPTTAGKPAAEHA